MDRDLTISFDIDGTLVWCETQDDDITGAAREFDLEIDDEAIGTYNDLMNQYFQCNTEPRCHRRLGRESRPRARGAHRNGSPRGWVQ